MRKNNFVRLWAILAAICTIAAVVAVCPLTAAADTLDTYNGYMSADDPLSGVFHTCYDEYRLIDRKSNTTRHTASPWITIDLENAAFLNLWGWVALNSYTFQIGYIVDGEYINCSESYKYPAEQAVLDQAYNDYGAATASRYNVTINMAYHMAQYRAKYPDHHENTFSITIVCINEQFKIIPLVELSVYVRDEGGYSELNGSLSADAVLPLTDTIYNLSRDEVTLLSKAVEAQNNLLSLGEGARPNPVFITMQTRSYDMQTNTKQYSYRVYYADSGVHEMQVPELRTGYGATMRFNTPTRLYVSNYDFNFSLMGATVGLREHGEVTTELTTAYALADNERVVWVYGAYFGGLCDSPLDDPLYSGGTTFFNAALRRWVDAYAAYTGGSTSGGEVQYQLGYTAGYGEGYDAGYSAGLLENDSASYDRGYDMGYADGKYDCATERHDAIYLDGYSQGWLEAYEENGYVIDVPSIITSVPNACKAFVNNAFGFELFGINVAGLLSTLLVSALVGVAIAFIIGKGKR